jgi:hypothetical protein
MKLKGFREAFTFKERVPAEAEVEKQKWRSREHKIRGN